jgi:hypothetical protein
MRTCLTLIAFIFFIQPCGGGQDRLLEFRHGTIIAWLTAPSRVIIVADSGVKSEVYGKLSEKACKIVALSPDTIYFYTGNLAQVLDTRTNTEIFSQEHFAREAYQNLAGKPRSYQKLVDLGTEFSALVRPKMDEILKIDRDPSQRVGLAGFASLDELNHPRLVLVTIPITVRNDGAPASTEAPKIFEWPSNKVGTGLTEQNMPVLEFWVAKTKRAKSAVAKFESSIPTLPKRDLDVYRLISAAEAALSWEKNDPSVGPPVDAVVLETGTGIRWVKRKPACDPGEI